MTYVALNVMITYVIAPLIAFAWVRSLNSPSPRLQAAVVSLSIGPIAISFFLFLLLHLFPHQSDTFYLLAVLVILSGFIVTLPGLIQAFDRRTISAAFMRLRRTIRAGLVRISTLTDPTLSGFVLAVIRLVFLSLALVTFGDSLNRSGYPIVDNFTSTTYWLLFLLTGGLALREIVHLMALIVSLHPQWLGPTALSFVLNPKVITRAVWAWGAIVAASITGAVIFAGLVNVIEDNDPLEYLLVSRAIFAAKSLTIYPMLTGLPETGLHAPSSHPPGLHLLDFWAYLFDGTDSTRLVRLSPLFYFLTLLGILYAYLLPFGLVAAILGPLLLLSVPLLSALAVVSHIDPMRIAFFVLSVFVTADAISRSSTGKEIVCGMVWGFSLYSHSLGLFGVFICAAVYLCLDNREIFARIRSIIVIFSVAGLVGGWQYLINIVSLGVPIQDSTAVWQIPTLQEARDLAYRRILSTPEDILAHGLFQNFTQKEIFGPAQIPELLIVVLGARLLWSSALGKVLVSSIMIFYSVLGLTVIFGTLSAVKNSRYILTVVPLLSAATAIVLGTLASRAICGSKQLANGVSSAGYVRQTYLFVLILACPVLVAAAGTQLRSKIGGSNPALVWEKRDREFIYDAGYAYGSLMRYLVRHPTRGRVLVFRQSDFAFYGSSPWVDYLDPSLLEFYRLEDKYKAYRVLTDRGIEFFFIPGPSSWPTAFYRTAAIEIAADPELADIVAIGGGGTLVRLASQRREVQCEPAAARKVSTIEWAPLNVGNLAARIFFRRNRPTVTSEFKYTPDLAASKSGGLPQRAQQLTRMEFVGIDVPADASLSEFAAGTQRMHLELDLAGEGLAEIALHLVAEGRTVDTRGLWTGLLESGGRRVTLQTVVPAGGEEIRVSINKYQGTIGRLEVRQARFCRFGGPPTLHP